MQRPEGSRRALSPVIGIALLAAIVVLLATVTGAMVLGFGDHLHQPAEQSVVMDTTGIIGIEYRDEDCCGGNETRPDVDHVLIRHEGGASIDGAETGTVIVRYSGDDGEGGELRFINPEYYDESTEQEHHEGTVGEATTGVFSAGDTMTVIVANNDYREGPYADGLSDGEKHERYGEYEESTYNQIQLSGEEVFVRTEGRYPLERTGDRTMRPGDDVTVQFLDSDHRYVIGEASGTVDEFDGTVTAGEDTGA